MGRWNGFSSLIVILLFLPLAFGLVNPFKETFFDLDPCPPNKVCTNFVYDSCRKVNGSWVEREAVGVVWTNSSVCRLSSADTAYARLEIELHTLHTWSIIVTSYGGVFMKAFSFANATLHFPNDTVAEFAWVSGGQHSVNHIPMEALNDVETGMWHFNHRCRQFNITANGEKLIALVGGPGILYTSKSESNSKYYNPRVIELADSRFLEQLEQHTECDSTEIKQACYDNCDKITFTKKHPYEAVCNAQLWYQNPEEGKLLRNWKKVDTIECNLGSWRAYWNGGSQVLDASLEVQCSKVQPAKMTDTMKKVLGYGIGVPLMLIIFVVIAIFVISAYRRRRLNNESRNKASTKRSSESTRKEKKSEYFFNTDRQTKSTDRECRNTDRNTKTSKRVVSSDSPGNAAAAKGAAAAASAARPNAASRPALLQEPKGAENAAGPPLPEGFASVMLA